MNDFKKVSGGEYIAQDWYERPILEYNKQIQRNVGYNRDEKVSSG